METNLATIIQKLRQLPRCERNSLLEKREDILPVEIIEKYERLRENELFHIKHCRTCWKILRPDSPPSQHDYSKDEYYFFVTIVCLSFGVKNYLPSGVFEEEVEFHYQKEPHHAQYEKLNPGACLSNEDIAEMAMDQLSRNLQFNGGEYNLELLGKYSPHFFRDHEIRIVMFRNYVEEFKDSVQKIWWEMKTAQ